MRHRAMPAPLVVVQGRANADVSQRVDHYQSAAWEQLTLRLTAKDRFLAQLSQAAVAPSSAGSIRPARQRSEGLMPHHEDLRAVDTLPDHGAARSTDAELGAGPRTPSGSTCLVTRRACQSEPARHARRVAGAPRAGHRKLAVPTRLCVAALGPSAPFAGARSRDEGALRR